MEIIPSDRTIELIMEYLPQIGINLPLKGEDDLGEISAFFADMESSMANGLVSGKQIDRKLLDDVSKAADETEPWNEDDYIDIGKINKRLVILGAKDI